METLVFEAQSYIILILFLLFFCCCCFAVDVIIVHFSSFPSYRYRNHQNCLGRFNHPSIFLSLFLSPFRFTSFPTYTPSLFIYLFSSSQSPHSRTHNRHDSSITFPLMMMMIINRSLTQAPILVPERPRSTRTINSYYNQNNKINTDTNSNLLPCRTMLSLGPGSDRLHDCLGCSAAP